jgi:hypothetical protein
MATAIILAVVFTSGVLLGLAADSGLSAEPTAPQGAAVAAEEAAEAETAEAESDAAVEATERRYTYHRVEPNEEQLARIDVIVAEWRARREAFDNESRDRWEAGRRELVLEVRKAIKSVLSPEQAAEYQRLLDDWDAEQAAESANEDDRN